MMKNAKQKWIELGYELFAKEGAEGIQVERLARILKLNKSGFYHYFKTPDNFLKELFNRHQMIARQMAIETKKCDVLDPDYFKVIVEFKMFVLVQGQLALKQDHSLYGSVVNEARQMMDKHLLPLWRETFNLPDDDELVSQQFSLFRNAFYAQANFDNLNYTFLHNMMKTNLRMMHEIFRHQYASRKNVTSLERKPKGEQFRLPFAALIPIPEFIPEPTHYSSYLNSEVN